MNLSNFPMKCILQGHDGTWFQMTVHQIESRREVGIGYTVTVRGIVTDESLAHPDEINIEPKKKGMKDLFEPLSEVNLRNTREKMVVPDDG